VPSHREPRPGAGFLTRQRLEQGTAWFFVALAALRGFLEHPLHRVEIGATYKPGEEKIESIDSFVSNVGESHEVRQQTRKEADAWYDSITADIFG
jgi:hypothetical protein